MSEVPPTGEEEPPPATGEQEPPPAEPSFEPGPPLPAPDPSWCGTPAARCIGEGCGSCAECVAFFNAHYTVHIVSSEAVRPGARRVRFLVASRANGLSTTASAEGEGATDREVVAAAWRQAAPVARGWAQAVLDRPRVTARHLQPGSF